MNYREIEEDYELLDLLENSQIIESIAFQSLDFTEVEKLTTDKKFIDCIFLGCTIPDELKVRISVDNLIFPQIKGPFNPYRNRLYDRHSLFNDYELGNPNSYENTLDKQVYDHFLLNGKEASDIKETLSRRLHDHAITDALHDFLEDYDEKKIVAIMGGHSLERGNKNYLEVAKMSKKLTELGYLMVSGGGPGAMEATHVGAWFADKEESELVRAINILAEAPSYKDKYWIDKAFEVLKLYPTTKYESVGIPTWLYGHEPPTPFATQIAKYFANSIREDGLLAIAKGGVIFSPGSAGTIQEIFQDATQNHYLSFGIASPMVFFNKKYWMTDRPVYPLLEKMLKEEKYENLILSICDTGDEVIKEILKFTSES